MNFHTMDKEDLPEAYGHTLSMRERIRIALLYGMFALMCIYVR